MPKLFITLFLSCVILNIKGCSPLASVLLLKQTTAIVTLIILRFTQRFTQLPLRGYVWEHISKRCRKAKRTDNRLIINPFLPVGVTGFEPATTRPPDAYSNRAELHPVVLFNGCKSTYLRGICKIFRRFFAQKKRFLIGFIYKFLLLSGIVDGCNGIRFPLFALSYF